MFNILILLFQVAFIQVDAHDKYSPFASWSPADNLAQQVNSIPREIEKLLGPQEVGWRMTGVLRSQCLQGWRCGNRLGSMYSFALAGADGELMIYYAPSDWVGFEMDDEWRKGWTYFGSVIEGRRRLFIGSTINRDIPAMKNVIEQIKKIMAGEYNCYSSDARCRKREWYIDDAIQLSARYQVRKMLDVRDISSDMMSHIAETCYEYQIPCLGLFERVIQYGSSMARIKSLKALRCLMGADYFLDNKNILSDKDMDVIKSAAYEIKSIDEPMLAKELLDLLDEYNVYAVVRRAIIHLIGNAGFKRAGDKIRRILLSTGAEEEAEECMRTLGLLGSTDALMEIRTVGEKFGMPEQGLYGSALLRLERKWGEQVDQMKLSVKLGTEVAKQGEKVKISAIMDPRGPAKMQDECHVPRWYDMVLLIDGKDVDWNAPHRDILCFNIYPELDIVEGDAPDVLTAKPGKKEVKVRIGKAVSNAVILVVK